ncbi:hypothetical protein DMENIID0001_150690 [Sergentomyia squamirostris]
MSTPASCTLLAIVCSLLFLGVPINADDTLPRRTSLDFQHRNRGSVTDVPPPASTTIIYGSSASSELAHPDGQHSITSPDTSNDASDYIRGLPVLSLVKRAPVGFMGMRGKKESEMDTFDDRITDYEASRDKKLFLNLPFRYIPKRAPSGFMGMRGKKFYLDSYKRAPSGFLGMRGKKGSEQIWPPIDDTQIEQDENTDLPEEEQLNEIYTKLDQERELLARLSEMYGLHLWDDEKRAPTNGFFGMRGKKNGDDQYTNKRAPMGFQGMRGKKWDGEEEIADDEGVDKRAPQMGFHGMRGKKDVSNVLLEDSTEKRAPSAGFFGMRGKKQPGYRRITADRRNLFGYMKSKKGPYEFRGKFVGVRGKKIPAGNELNELLMELDENQADGWLETPQLIQVADEAPMKRVPSGFMGMRGKKWSEASSDEQ